MTRKVTDRLAAIAYNLSTPGAWDGRDETNKLITDLLDDRESDGKTIATQAEALRMAKDTLGKFSAFAYEVRRWQAEHVIITVNDVPLDIDCIQETQKTLVAVNALVGEE